MKALILIGVIYFISAVSGLKCYVGLGNSSKKKEQILVECGDEKHFACVKMFGGGMGDQIRRKCEKLHQTEWEELLDKEELKQRAYETGDSLDSDPACEDTTNHGRPVRVCYCSTDQCNGVVSMRSNVDSNILLIATLFSLFINSVLNKGY